MESKKSAYFHRHVKVSVLTKILRSCDRQSIYSTLVQGIGNHRIKAITVILPVHLQPCRLQTIAWHEGFRRECERGRVKGERWGMRRG